MFQVFKRILSLVVEVYDLITKIINSRYYGIIGRCYDEKDDHYGTYGGKGVIVSDEWLNDKTKFATWFMEQMVQNGISVDELNQYHVDKDILCDEYGVFPKIYSSETCLLVHRDVNRKHVDFDNMSHQRNVIGVSPCGKVHRFRNQRRFARENGLNRGNIGSCLKGVRTHTKGWTFKYADV